MSFNFLNIRKNTPVDHKLLYAMARNDDYLKNIYDHISKGIISWSELDSSASISGLDREARNEATEDPNWSTLTEITIFGYENEAISFDFWALSNIIAATPSTSLASTSYRWVAGHRIRLRLQQGEEEVGSGDTVDFKSYARSIYEDTGEFHFSNFGARFESGVIRGKCLAIATKNFRTTPTAIRRDFYKNYPLIPTGKIKVSLDINRLDASQTLNAASNKSCQVVAKNLGEWLYV